MHGLCAGRKNISFHRLADETTANEERALKTSLSDSAKT
jgi:hypothetical protein